MTPRYPHLLSPLVVRGKVFKNRMCDSNSLPHFLQGLEPYPADTVIAHYENKAKSAAVVTCMGLFVGPPSAYPLMRPKGSQGPVMSAGMRPNQQQALAFYGTAPEFYMIGDCKKPATIQQAMRQAYATAMRI